MRSYALASKRFRGVALAALALMTRMALAQAPQPLGKDPYVTVAGNFDVGYHKTQFFEPNHHVAVAQWDSRLEIWAPPFRTEFAWGVYVRATGIVASKSEAWENAWLAEPGVGLQMYPFSLPAFRNSSNKVAKALGPLRLFGEYNRMNYWGKENVWRPTKQTRYGAEHWRSLHVNDVEKSWWAETWNGLWWQSANEFDPRYRSTIFANAVRAGVRKTGKGAVSAITPYVAVESSLTGNAKYYWENRLLAGGGIRVAPPIPGAIQRQTRINRLAIYGEYLRVGAYYTASREANADGVPRHEVRIGLTFSTGLWYY